jgi:hypothetical protein
MQAADLDTDGVDGLFAALKNRRIGVGLREAPRAQATKRGQPTPG